MRSRPLFARAFLAAAAAIEIAACGWNPAAVTGMFAHHDRLSGFSYLHRPRGYHWKARRTRHGAIEYYGIDPSNGWTVYVGPDNVYYTFAHPGDIGPTDLSSLWDPHDAHSRETSQKR